VNIIRVDSEFRHNPGAIEAIEQHPTDDNQVINLISV